ncbi:hypothetical protein BFN01_02135 [Microbacterium sp. AR7-10]|nr:hypothetical protein BFN01_02135 [Microbacterium sp. AR7-10]
MADVAKDPASQFGVQLNATIGEKVQPVANDVVATAVTAQDIPGKVATATGAAITDANIPALVDEAAGPAVTAEATEQLPALVTAEVALRVPPAVDTAITGADIPGKVAIALAAQAGKILQGTGMPNGVVTAGVGTLYVDTATTMGASVWRKATGTGNTGWTVMEGDTGWRTLTSWDSAGVVSGAPLVAGMTPTPGSAGFIRIIRTNNDVGPVISGATFTASTSYIDLPAGFGPTNPQRKTLVALGTLALSCSLNSARLFIDNIPAGTATGTAYGASASWVTNRDWPTTLPGTAA